MASQREERIARNEAAFRKANERVKGWEERHRFDSEAELYLCECGNPECVEKIRLRKADYERIRMNPIHFVVVPGHEVPDVETVIEAHEGWAMVEKAPEVRHIVDPPGLG